MIFECFSNRYLILTLIGNDWNVIDRVQARKMLNIDFINETFNFDPRIF